LPTAAEDPTGNDDDASRLEKSLARQNKKKTTKRNPKDSWQIRSKQVRKFSEEERKEEEEEGEEQKKKEKKAEETSLPQAGDSL
jgi:hypothetical protein